MLDKAKQSKKELYDLQVTIPFRFKQNQHANKEGSDLSWNLQHKNVHLCSVLSLLFCSSENLPKPHHTLKETFELTSRYEADYTLTC